MSLTAYSGPGLTGISLGSVSTSTDGFFLSINAAGIKSAIFQQAGNTPATWLIDNLTYDVPEPGTLALFGRGLAGLGIARRKKSA